MMLEQFCVAISTENSAIQNGNAIKINTLQFITHQKLSTIGIENTLHIGDANSPAISFLGDSGNRGLSFFHSSGIGESRTYRGVKKWPGPREMGSSGL